MTWLIRFPNWVRYCVPVSFCLGAACLYGGCAEARAWGTIGIAGVEGQGGRPSLVSTVDYPPEALRARQQGVVGYRITVGIEGRVTACTVTRSSGFRALDEATCRVMRDRAIFTPARDDQGNPRVDVVESRFRWTLPDD